MIGQKHQHTTKEANILTTSTTNVRTKSIRPFKQINRIAIFMQAKNERQKQSEWTNWSNQPWLSMVIISILNVWTSIFCVFVFINPNDGHVFSFASHLYGEFPFLCDSISIELSDGPSFSWTEKTTVGQHYLMKLLWIFIICIAVIGITPSNGFIFVSICLVLSPLLIDNLHNIRTTEPHSNS